MLGSYKTWDHVPEDLQKRCNFLAQYGDQLKDPSSLWQTFICKDHVQFKFDVLSPAQIKTVARMSLDRDVSVKELLDKFLIYSEWLYVEETMQKFAVFTELQGVIPGCGCVGGICYDGAIRT